MATVTPSAGPTSPVAPTEIAAPDTNEGAVTDLTAPKEDPLSSKFAILAKKEKALRAKYRELEAREAKLIAQAPQPVDPIEALKARLSESPLEALSDLGLSYDQLTQAVLNSKPEDQKLSAIEKKIKMMEDVQTKAQQAFEEQQQKNYDQAVSQIRTDVKLLVDGDSNFETIKALGAEESVVELIKSHFDETGSVLTNNEAAQMVEDYLIEEAMKMTSLSKIKSKMSPPQAEPTEATKTASPQQKQSLSVSPRTLTNSIAQSTSKPLSVNDRRARAIAAFQGKLT